MAASIPKPQPGDTRLKKQRSDKLPEAERRARRLAAQKRYRDRHSEQLNAKTRGRYALKDPASRFKDAWRTAVSRAKRDGYAPPDPITLAERDAMLAAQGGRCACCGSSTPRNRHNWHTDHDHQTGRIRGVLCLTCNRTLGILGDVLSAVEGRCNELLAYLRRTS